MKKENYQAMAQKIMEKHQGEAKRPTLLLHACCAPCATVPLVDLSSYFDMGVYYYNPNIWPEEEAKLRADELLRFVASYPFDHPPQVMVAPYDAKPFWDCIVGWEHEPEGGKRCERCFALRLQETARMAREKGFDYFTTTLSISPHKDAVLLHRLGLEAAEEAGVTYLPADFKKKGGTLRSVGFSKTYALHRQDYCGCVFSKKEAQARRKETNERIGDV